MQNEGLAGLLIATTLVWWSVRRDDASWFRLAVALGLFAGLSACVIHSVATPLKPAFDPAGSSIFFGQQVMVACWWLLGAKLLAEVTRFVFRSRRLAHGGRLIPDLLAGLFYVAGALGVVGAVFGLPIGALVATSGVIAIVLGLALQSTLSDVFSGIAVSLEQPYAIGDRILIDGQTEGNVVQITWRSVRIQTDGDDVATVPNSIAAKSRIINRSVPSRRRRDTVQIPCPSVVPAEQATELVRNALLLCPNVLPEPAASVAISELGRRFNTYQVAFSAADGAALWTARTALLMQVVRQFRAAGIVGPEVRQRELDDEKHEAVAIALFHALAAEQLAVLAEGTVRRVLGPGDTLFAEGSSGSSLFIVMTGVLEVVRMIDATPSVVGRIGPGDYIGEISLLTGVPHGASVTALTRAVVRELRSEALTPLLADRPDLLHALEVSARRGQTYLERAVAASVGAGTVAPLDLLSRIRSYFAGRRPADGR